MRERMQGVVMAGGLGTRLRPLTFKHPKPFLPVAGRAVVEWGILSLARAGITDIVVTTAYKKSKVQEHLGEGERFGVRLQYAEEKTPLGTAGGVKNAEELITGPFVVMSADVVADVDLAKVIAFHRDHDALATIALTHVAEPTAYGIVGLDDDGAITRFKEKPTKDEVFSDLTNSGIFVVERQVLERVPKDKVFDWSKDVWSHMIGERLYGVPVEGYWKDVGQPRDLIAANQHQAERIGQWIFGEVQVLAGADVNRTVLMDRSIVADGAEVDGSLLMRRVQVGPGALVRGSVLADDVIVGSGAVVEDCVLGHGVVVPDGARWSGMKVPDPEKVVESGY